MEEEEEEIVVRNWIYKEENDDGPIFDVYDDDEEEEVYILDQHDISDDLIPFTNILWGDRHGLVNEASTSRIENDSDIENNDERTYSNKYELDLFLERSIIDLGINVIHAYDAQPSIVNEILNSHIPHEPNSPVIGQLDDSK